MRLRAFALFISVCGAVGACSSDEESSSTGGASGSAGSAGSAGSGATGGGGTAGASGAGGSVDAGEDAGPPATCEQLCSALLAAGCTAFTVTQQECEQMCDAVKAGPCGAEWNDLLQCAGPTPQFACNSLGEPTVAGCFDEEQAYTTCDEASQGDGG